MDGYCDLRFTEGVTFRANSVIPINYTGNSKFIENDIEMVENAYASFNLYIADVFVVPEFRCQKIASSMLKTLIKEWAVQEGAKRVL
jgi:hypothetical protein